MVLLLIRQDESLADNIGNSLRVIAGTRACYEVGPGGDRNLDRTPGTIARRVRRFISQAVDFAEIIDYLLVHSIEVREFTRAVIICAFA